MLDKSSKQIDVKIFICPSFDLDVNQIALRRVEATITTYLSGNPIPPAEITYKTLDPVYITNDVHIDSSLNALAPEHKTVQVWASLETLAECEASDPTAVSAYKFENVLYFPAYAFVQYRYQAVWLQVKQLVETYVANNNLT
jgi:hypothetical protein